MHFIITFGFSLSIKRNANATEDKVTIKKAQISRKKKNDRNDSSIGEVSMIIIDVGQTLAEIHVEYDLLPNYRFKFDCRCWESAVKIYAEDSEWCLKPIPCSVNENTYWILFSIHHVVQLNEVQIKKFFNYIIVCNFFFGRQKLSERTRKEKVKGFYIDEENFNMKEGEFLQIYPLDLNKFNATGKYPTSPDLQTTIIADATYGDFSISTYLDVLPDNIHERKFRKMLRKARFPSESFNCELIISRNNTEEEITTQLKTPKENIHIKKIKKGKQGEITGKLGINLPAEALFSDTGIITSYSRTPKLNISSVLIYAQCQNILSNKQLRISMNPIYIKMEQLSNLPVDTLIKNNIEWIYAKIYFVKRMIITPCYRVNPVTYFEFVKCFLCNEFEPDELIQFLATEFLRIEIIGIRSINIKRFQTSTSEQLDPNAHWTIKSSMAPEMRTKVEILLGVAEFDVSNLLRGHCEVKLASSLFHSPYTYYGNTEKTINEISPLPADILISSCTSLKMKIRLAYDLRELQANVLCRKSVLNRIFLNFHDVKNAYNILKDVFSHNSNILNTCQVSNKNDHIQEQKMLKHIITGFAIESCERIYIFLEGLSNGYLLKIWKYVKKLVISYKCIYYNSDYIFLTRLYENFIPLGGILHIKLSQPLEKEFHECSFYIGQRRRTLKTTKIRKIGLMNLALTMRSLCQRNLFPDPNEVKSFIDNVEKTDKKDTTASTITY